MPQSFIEINRAALRHNFRAVQNHTQTPIIAVVKANAYGCGALECAKIFEQEGAQMLAVTRADEAIPLREGGVQLPILLLAPALSDEYEAALKHDLTFSIGSFEEAQALSVLAFQTQKTARVHVKINTGMNRFGAHPSKTVEIVARSRNLPNLRVEGVFSHLANATAPDEKPSLGQFETFNDAVYGLDNLTFHLANSAAALRFPEMRLGAIRPGTLLYGQYPDPSIQKIADLKLQNPFQLRAQIVALQNLKPGESFGYGSQWTAKRDSKLAILAVGFADGVAMEPNARPLSPLDAIKAGLEKAARLQKNPNAGRMVEIRGQKFPIVGRIAMQTCAVDVTGNEEIGVGDLATVPVRRLAAQSNLQRVYKD